MKTIFQGARASSPRASLAAVLAAFAPAAAAEPDIRDIRGPIVIPSVWPVLLMILGAAALAVALGMAVYWLVRRLRRAALKTAAEIALERLERARTLATDGRAAELGAELSDAVRDYIQARFELRAPHRTTEEFLHDLLAASESPVAAHRDSLGDFLGACDLAKFARFALDVEHMRAMIDAAESFVRATAAPRPAGSKPTLHGALTAQGAQT